MGHLAGCGVGEVAYVAAFDVHAFAAANIGDVQLDVLRAPRLAFAMMPHGYSMVKGGVFFRMIPV
jgi:hypothetical protein